MTDLPAITGKQLIRLLLKDGWTVRRKANHGISLTKYVPESDRTLVTVVPDKNRPLTKNTLGLILGFEQTQIGRKGLESLIREYGLK